MRRGYHNGWRRYGYSGIGRFGRSDCRFILSLFIHSGFCAGKEHAAAIQPVLNGRYTLTVEAVEHLGKAAAIRAVQAAVAGDMEQWLGTKPIVGPQELRDEIERFREATKNAKD